VELILPSGDLVASLFSTPIEGSGSSVPAPSAAQVSSAIEGLAEGWIEYVILQEGDEFVQAAGEGNGPYRLERCEGDPAGIWYADGPIDRSTLTTVLLSFHRRDADWTAHVPWLPNTAPATSE